MLARALSRLRSRAPTSKRRVTAWLRTKQRATPVASSVRIAADVDGASTRARSRAMVVQRAQAEQGTPTLGLAALLRTECAERPPSPVPQPPKAETNRHRRCGQRARCGAGCATQDMAGLW
jgi:hypothetical protein